MSKTIVFKHPQGYKIKRKNKRIVIAEDKNDPSTLLVQVAIFDKEEGHFGLIESHRGIKHVTMRITEETAGLMASYLLQYLAEKQEQK